MTEEHGGTKTAAGDFKHRVAEAIADERIAAIFDKSARGKDDARRAILPELGDALTIRNLAARIKDHTLQNLDRYLEQLIDNVHDNGGRVHFAANGQQALRVGLLGAREKRRRGQLSGHKLS